MLKMEFKFKYTILITTLQTILVSVFLVKVKKNVRKSQAQFRQKLRKVRLRQNYGFLTKKHVGLIGFQIKKFLLSSVSVASINC